MKVRRIIKLPFTVFCVVVRALSESAIIRKESDDAADCLDKLTARVQAYYKSVRSELDQAASELAASS